MDYTVLYPRRQNSEFPKFHLDNGSTLALVLVLDFQVTITKMFLISDILQAFIISLT
jgi:hypothetical protein